MQLGGPGASILDPWLALTSEGRDILALGFNAGANGTISREMADRANVWFRRYADNDRDMRLTDEEIRLALAHASKEAAAAATEPDSGSRRSPVLSRPREGSLS